MLSFQQESVPGLGGFVRLSPPAEGVTSELGPLANLLGTWVGSNGWNLIAVPKGSNSFTLLVRPYTEMITFEPVGALVPDRGGVDTLFLAGVSYSLRVSDAQTNQPLHVESGLWLYLSQNAETGDLPIVRQAVIPHGNSVLATGNFETIAGAPNISDRSALPTVGPKPPLGYTDPYLNSVTPPFQVANVTGVLQEGIKNQNITQTTTLTVSTANGQGGIVNIPFITRHANATQFEGVFWIETVQNEDGSTFQQLQYFQQTNIEFIPRFGDPSQLILWPHTNVNTLVKQ